MKNFYFILFLISSSISSLYGQPDLGLKFGYSNFKKIEDCKKASCFEHNSLHGINVGLVGTFLAKEKLEVNGELFYTSKGSNLGKNFSYNLENHLALPILVRYKLFDKLSIYAGPEVSYLLSFYFVDKDFIIDKVNLDSYTFYDRLDLGLSAGVSFQFANKWKLDLRFVEGGFSRKIDFKIKNRGFYISLHRYFGSLDKNK